MKSTKKEFSDFLKENSKNMQLIIESLSSFKDIDHKSQAFHLLKYFYLYKIDKKLEILINTLDIDMGA